MKQEDIIKVFNKWIKILRIENNWDVTLELVNDENFKKTGDFKIDITDKKAVILLNVLNPKQENFEEVICHELLHIKMYPLDQLTESLIDGHYIDGSNEKTVIYNRFMINLETTVEELTKCFLLAFGENKELSYGRCRSMKSFNELYENLNSYNID